MFYFFIKFVSQNRVFIAIYKKVRFIFSLIRFTKRAESVNPWNLIVSTTSQSLVCDYLS